MEDLHAVVENQTVSVGFGHVRFFYPLMNLILAFFLELQGHMQLLFRRKVAVIDLLIQLVVVELLNRHFVDVVGLIAHENPEFVVIVGVARVVGGQFAVTARCDLFFGLFLGFGVGPIRGSWVLFAAGGKPQRHSKRQRAEPQPFQQCFCVFHFGFLCLYSTD